MCSEKLFSLVCTLLIISACKSIPTYYDTEGPLWEKNEPTALEGSDSTLHVISFNLKNGDATEKAIDYFSNLGRMDVLFIQEADDLSVSRLAESLSMNYIYYPITQNLKKGINYGNAVLLRGGILESKKIILPHEKWTNGRKRAMTMVEACIKDTRIILYSLHRETIVMGPRKRLDQIESVLKSTQSQSDNLSSEIVAGDFNTFFNSDKEKVVTRFEEEGFEHASSGVGYTSMAVFKLIRAEVDHIFFRNLELIECGKMEVGLDSDHFPVFARFKF